MRRSMSFGYGRPEASHSLGYMLMEVKPGIVLSSLMKIFPFVRSRKKSQRAIPVPSMARKERTA